MEVLSPNRQKEKRKPVQAHVDEIETSNKLLIVKDTERNPACCE